MQAREPSTVGGFSLAKGLFTLLPAPAVATIDRDAARRAMAWFPWLGACLGIAAGALGWVAATFAGPLLGAVLGLALVELVTGCMHLDGLADTADGLGARGKPANDALAIMKKPDIGPMGVAAIVLGLLIQVAAAGSLPTPLALAAALALAPLVGRTTTVLACGTWVPNARPGGFGALFAGVSSARLAGLTVAATLALGTAAGWLVGGPLGAVALVLAAAAALLVATVAQRALVRIFGGLTGDMMGALIEIGVAVFLVGAAIGL